MTPLRFLLIALLTELASIAHAGEPLVTFASGRAEVILPDNFTVVSSDTSGLVATFGPKRDHKLELSLNDIESSLGSADLGEQFVRAQAEKKGRKLSLGAGRVVFMDPAGDSKQGEVTMRVVHWQIGFGRSVVVMTLTAPVEQPMSPALQEFLGRYLNVLVASLRRTGA